MTMHKLFARQLEKARLPTGAVDLDVLTQLVVQAYEEAEQDRLRTDRSIGLMVAELSEFQAGLEVGIAKRTAALRKSRKALHLQNSRFSAALAHMVQGLSLFDANQRLVICNRQYLELYGLPKRCARPGTSYRAILMERIRTNSSVGDDPEAYLRERLRWAAEGKPSSSVFKTNHGRFISVNHQPLAGGGWVSTHMDVTDIHKLQDELAHLAYFDSLTDLPNRNLLLQRIGQAFAAPHRDGFSLLIVDLDGFKAINDTLGHASGDMLLREVAIRLSGCIGATDLVGRLGGDEFALLLGHGHEAPEASETAAAVRHALRRPFDVGAQKISVAASIGIALAPADGDTAAMLLKSADLALHAAKKDGQGACRFFEPAMDTALQDRRRLEQELARALENGEFELNYQPVLDLKSTAFSGFEALLRWRHPMRGLVPPGNFIPLAEELGLIVPIGEWVIREAFAEAVSWPSDLRVAVNVSSIQFERGNLVAVVMNALAATGLAPHRVEIEITESVFLANSAQNLEILHQLHMLGVRIALDDFGTGYSALSYLLSFPFDKIKIDGSFVRAVENAEGAYAILRAVFEIGNRMGMTTTAEGVETAEQLRKVHAVGYTEVQGFLVSRPITAGALRRMLADGDVMPEVPFMRRVTG